MVGLVGVDISAHHHGLHDLLGADSRHGAYDESMEDKAGVVGGLHGRFVVSSSLPRWDEGMAADMDSVCLISVIRTIYLNTLLYVQDQTWEMTVIANWSTAEMNVAIICGCMPTLKPILSKAFGPLVDQVLPKQHQELEEPSEGRPRTIGSMPMRAFRFGRSTKTQVETVAEEPAGPWTEKGTASLTEVETNRSGQVGKEVDPEMGLGSGGSRESAKG